MTTERQETMTTCSDCAGTGGGHPDNVGYRCSQCGGSGGVRDVTDDVMVQRVFMATVDPMARMNGHPMPAATTLLYRICGNDSDKFQEATRLVELFIQQALVMGCDRDGK